MKNELNLTELELKVVNVLKEADWYEDMPTECMANLVDYTTLSAKVLRGVLSSLIQKEIVCQGEFPNGKTAFHYLLND